METNRMTADSRPSVLIADDHPEMLRAVRRLLALECDVAGIVSDRDELMEAARQLQPDVIVIDVHLGDVDGMDVCREITHRDPGAKVIMVSALDDATIRQRSVEAGASAFVHKMMPEDLLSAIQRVWAERG